MLPIPSARNLLAVAVIAILTCTAAAAPENLDAGKPPQKLFAEGCATCHRSARGLSKGRFTLTLYLFLQQHYASNSSSAWALTSYLEAVDAEKRGVKRAASTPPRASSASPPPAPSTWSSRSLLRPPAPVPNR